MIVSAKIKSINVGNKMVKQIRKKTSLSIEEDLYKRIEIIAEKERRSVTQMVNVLLEEALVTRKKEEDKKEKDV